MSMALTLRFRDHDRRVGGRDVAREPLFTSVDESVFRRPTFKSKVNVVRRQGFDPVWGPSRLCVDRIYHFPAFLRQHRTKMIGL